MTDRRNLLRFAIIGAGKVGTSFARYILDQKYELRAIVETNLKRRDALEAEFGASRIFTSIERIPESVTHILICTSDQAINSVARELATVRSLNATFIAHTSGILSSTELELLRSNDRRVGSIHPIQSFHSMDLHASHMNGIACGIEGDDAFISEGEALAERFGWTSIRVRSESKALYHAACVFAGNFITALVEDARTIMNTASTSPVEMHHILPIMMTVLHRLADTPAAEALTGPAVRGDTESVSMHIHALKEVDSELAEIYALWTKRILEISGSDEEIRKRIIAALGE